MTSCESTRVDIADLPWSREHIGIILLSQQPLRAAHAGCQDSCCGVAELCVFCF